MREASSLKGSWGSRLLQCSHPDEVDSISQSSGVLQTSAARLSTKAYPCRRGGDECKLCRHGPYHKREHSISQLKTRLRPMVNQLQNSTGSYGINVTLVGGSTERQASI